MLTKALGIDINKIFMTGLSLVGLYLILGNAPALNTLVKTSLRGGTDTFLILQGKTPPNYAKG